MVLQPVRRLRCCAKVLALALLQSASALQPLSDWVNGIATYYGGQADGMDPYSPSYGTADGACGYGYIKKNQWPYWSVGALTPGNQFAKAGPAHACGECFEIWCQDGSPGGNCNPDPNQRRVTIMISDVCEPCSPPGDDHIDLQALTFLKIAPWSGGQIYIRYRKVDCTPPGSIKIELMNVNGDYGWLRLTAQEVGGTGSITAIQVKGYKSDTWEGMTNKWGAAWEMDHAPQYPLDIHLTNDQGQELTAYEAIYANGATSSNLPPGIQFTVHVTPAPGPGGQPVVTAFGGGNENPACQDPSVAAFSIDKNAQTPQSSNGNLPNCPVPPSPPPPSAQPPPTNPTPLPQPAANLTASAIPASPMPVPGQAMPAMPTAGPSPVPESVPTPVPIQVPAPVPVPVPVAPPMTPPVMSSMPPPVLPSPPLPASPSAPVMYPTGSQPQQAPVVTPAAPNSPAQSQGGSLGCQATCTDIAPDSQYTCLQQAQFGKCVQPYMMQKTAAAPQGFCALSCQRCVKCG